MGKGDRVSLREGARPIVKDARRYPRRGALAPAVQSFAPTAILDQNMLLVLRGSVLGIPRTPEGYQIRIGWVD